MSKKIDKYDVNFQPKRITEKGTGRIVYSIYKKDRDKISYPPDWKPYANPYRWLSIGEANLKEKAIAIKEFNERYEVI